MSFSIDAAVFELGGIGCSCLPLEVKRIRPLSNIARNEYFKDYFAAFLDILSGSSIVIKP